MVNFTYERWIFISYSQNRTNHYKCFDHPVCNNCLWISQYNKLKNRIKIGVLKFDVLDQGKTKRSIDMI